MAKQLELKQIIPIQWIDESTIINLEEVCHLHSFIRESNILDPWVKDCAVTIPNMLMDLNKSAYKKIYCCIPNIPKVKKLEAHDLHIPRLTDAYLLGGRL